MILKLFSFFSLKFLIVPLILVAVTGIYWYGSHVGSLKSKLEQSESTRRKEYHQNLRLAIKSEEVRQMELKNLDLTQQLENFLQQDTELDQVCFTPELSQELNRILE